MAQKYIRFRCTVSGDYVGFKGPFMDLRIEHCAVKGDGHTVAVLHDSLGWRHGKDTQESSRAEHSCKNDECYNSEDRSCYCTIEILDEKDCAREDE